MVRLRGASTASEGGTSTSGGAASVGGAEGGTTSEALVPSRDDDSKSKLTLSVATVCGVDGDGTDEGEPPVLATYIYPVRYSEIYIPCPRHT